MTLADLIRRALRSINAFQAGDDVPATDLETCRDIANDMLDAWRLDGRTLYRMESAIYPLVLPKGSAALPYTIGPGGAFDQIRPLWIPRAELINNDTSAVTELELLTDDGFSAIAAGTVSAEAPTALYYRTDFTSTAADSGLGDIILYPLPTADDGDLSVRIYTPRAVVKFPDLAATDYEFPPGYGEALRYQLAVRFAVEYGREAPKELLGLAESSLALLRTPLPRLPLLRGQFLTSTLIAQALRSIAVLQPGGVMTPAQASAGLEALNGVVNTWRTQGRTLYQLLVAEYTLAANRGGVSDPYTIGPGGDFDQVRPLWIDRATLRDESTDLTTELELLTDDAWSDLAAGDVSAQRCTALYYRTDFVTTVSPTAGVGNVLLYPIPMSTGITLVLTLYTPIPVVEFADLNTTRYTFPPGYAEALRYQLALRLAPEYGKTPPPDLVALATSAFNALRAPVSRMPLLRGGSLASNLLAKALRTINVLRPGDQMTPAQAEVALEATNDMFDSWAAQRLTIFQVKRSVYPLYAGKGAPSTPYTIGPGGDFDQARPLWIPNAELLVRSTDPPFEMPLDILRDDPYARTSIKGLTSALPTELYYNYRYDTSGASVGLGEIFLYPVPNGQQPISLVLYTPLALTGFADLNTTRYSFPPGYEEALRYQIALRLAIEFGVTPTAELVSMAAVTFGVIKRPNARVPLLRVDRGMAGMAGGGWYNWRSGTTDRRD